MYIILTPKQARRGVNVDDLIAVEKRLNVRPMVQWVRQEFERMFPGRRGVNLGQLVDKAPLHDTAPAMEEIIRQLAQEIVGGGQG